MKFTFPPESKPLDGYTIKRAIHRGGFGEVYYALSDAGKEVALKLLQQHLEIELRGVSQCLNLKHPNLVTIFDIRTDDDGDHWIIMEFIAGKTLAAIIQDQDAPFPLDDVQDWLSGIVAGLSYLHDRGIVHRDLKPGNIFRDNGLVKIGDVGLSKFISESRRSAQTQSVGTVYYMAPEVAHGRYGREVDVYSLGVILYELLAGRVPFDGESTGEILMKHLTEKPDLSPLPNRLQPVLARALEKDPLRRTSTADQLLDDFSKAVRGVEIPVEFPPDSFTAGADAVSSTVNTLAEQPFGGSSATSRKAVHQAAREARKAAKRERRAARHTEQATRFTAGSDDADVASTAPIGTGHSQRWSWRRADGTWDPQFVHWVKMAPIFIIVLAFIRPSALVAITEFLFAGGIFAALGYGVYRLFGLLPLPASAPRVSSKSKPPPETATVGASSADQPDASPPQTVPVTIRQPALQRRGRKYGPSTLRQIPLRYRTADLTGAMTYAVLATGLVTALMWLLMPSPFFTGSGTNVLDPARIGLFAITTLLGSWALLLPAKLWEGTSQERFVRRLVQLGMGCLVGTAAFWLHQNLMVGYLEYNLLAAKPEPQAVIKTVGSHQLFDESTIQPTLAGYIIFFGGLFALRRWWHQIDTFRKSRFRLVSLLLSTLVGFVLPTVLAFPHNWGMMWALAISIVVQLSSAWVPEEDRERLMEGGTNA